jgi:hypothetical protein
MGHYDSIISGLCPVCDHALFAGHGASAKVALRDRARRDQEPMLANRILGAEFPRTAAGIELRSIRSALLKALER